MNCMGEVIQLYKTIYKLSIVPTSASIYHEVLLLMHGSLSYILYLGSISKGRHALCHRYQAVLSYTTALTQSF